jgi:hypothetical protein
MLAKQVLYHIGHTSSPLFIYSYIVFLHLANNSALQWEEQWEEGNTTQRRHWPHPRIVNGLVLEYRRGEKTFLDSVADTLS